MCFKCITFFTREELCVPKKHSFFACAVCCVKVLSSSTRGPILKCIRKKSHCHFFFVRQFNSSYCLLKLNMIFICSSLVFVYSVEVHSYTCFWVTNEWHSPTPCAVRLMKIHYNWHIIWLVLHTPWFFIHLFGFINLSNNIRINVCLTYGYSSTPNRKVAWGLEMSIHLHSLRGDLHSLSVHMEGSVGKRLLHCSQSFHTVNVANMSSNVAMWKGLIRPRDYKCYVRNLAALWPS